MIYCGSRGSIRNPNSNVYLVRATQVNDWQDFGSCACKGQGVHVSRDNAGRWHEILAHVVGLCADVDLFAASHLGAQSRDGTCNLAIGGAYI